MGMKAALTRRDFLRGAFQGLTSGDEVRASLEGANLCLFETALGYRPEEKKPTSDSKG